MEIETYFRFVGALLFVLALIGGAGWAARRFGLGGRLAPNPGKARRLSVVEVATLDSRRKLVLVRRDATEHLLLLGPGQDVLVEGGIVDRSSGHEASEGPRLTVQEPAARQSFEETLRNAT